MRQCSTALRVCDAELTCWFAFGSSATAMRWWERCWKRDQMWPSCGSGTVSELGSWSGVARTAGHASRRWSSTATRRFGITMMCTRTGSLLRVDLLVKWSSIPSKLNQFHWSKTVLKWNMVSYYFRCTGLWWRSRTGWQPSRWRRSSAPVWRSTAPWLTSALPSPVLEEGSWGSVE